MREPTIAWTYSSKRRAFNQTCEQTNADSPNVLVGKMVALKPGSRYLSLSLCLDSCCEKASTYCTGGAWVTDHSSGTETHPNEAREPACLELNLAHELQIQPDRVFKREKKK
jgi:hypothetical protein